MSTTQLRPVDTAAPPASPATLVIVLTCVFMLTMDFFLVNVAIPALRLELGASPAAVQWVVAGFGLAYGVGMITGGRLGDRYGRRRMFGIGIAAFTVASVACGLAPSAGLLVAGRVAQGLAASLVSPQVLAILRTAYQGVAQARAFSAYGLTMGLAAVLGQLIGGLLIRADVFGLGWRACFLINLPVGVAALIATRTKVPESRAPGKAKLDIIGITLVTAALVALLLPLIEGRDAGWPAWTWLSLVLSGVLFVAFAAHQRAAANHDGAPLVDPAMFAARAFTAGLVAQFVFWLGQASFFLVFALYLQDGRGLDPLGAGLVFAVLAVGYLVTSMRAHVLARLLGRQVLLVGGLVMAAALATLSVTVTHAGLGWLLPAIALDGLGMGMVIGPLAATVLAGTQPRHVGAAAGVLATAQQVGNAVGVAVVGLVYYHALGGGVAHAFAVSLAVLVGVGVTLAAVTQALPRDRAA